MAKNADGTFSNVSLSATAGTVTSVSVVSANGFAGSVATATSTPAITLTTSITGVLKGNGTAISAASAGSDYVAPGAATGSGLTMSTNKVLGRATAGTGAIEELSTNGSGNVVLTTSPSLTTPNIGVASGTSLAVTGVMTTGSNSGTNGQITFYGSTSGTVAVRAAAAAGTGTVFQLPATNGTNTYVLQTDGNGVTSWVAAGTGTVTAISIASSNGFAGSSGGGATPILTISTSITGVLKGNGTAISAATAGTDYTVGSTGLAGGQTIAGGTLTTQGLTLRANAADTTTGTIAITTSTSSTTKTTGALTIAGGLGVAGAIYTNDLSVTNTITGTTSGNYVTGGALGTPSSGTLTNCGSLPISGLTASTSTALGVGSIELGHASDTTIARSGAGAITVEGVQVILSGAALGTPSSGTLTNCGSLPISGLTASTSTALGVGSIELGHASDTTIARVSAGVISVEGATVAMLSAAQTFTAQNKFNNIIDVSNAVTVSSNAATVPVTYRLTTVTNNAAGAVTITMTTTSAVDGQMTIVRFYDYSAAAQTITWSNTENSTVTAPTTSNGSTTLPLTVGFMYNGATSKWRCIASA